MYKWLDFVLAQEKVPQTISTSYGDDEQTGKLFVCFSESLFGHPKSLLLLMALCQFHSPLLSAFAMISHS